MSIASVTAAAEHAARSQQALKTEIARAIEAGVPNAAVARAAGVTPNTVRRWLAELEHHTDPDSRD